MTTSAGGHTRFERSAAFWLRAYPRRWRAVRGAEVTAVLADLAPAGATRLDLRSALGLLRGGWATRWRERPPLRVIVGYRWRWSVPDVRYRAWVRDDIDGPLFALRQSLWGAFPALVMPAYLAVQGVYPPEVVVGALLLIVTAAGFGATRDRRRAAGFALRAAPDDPVGQWGLLTVSTLRDRWSARPVLAWWTALLATGAVGWGAASLVVAARAVTCAVESEVCGAGGIRLRLVPLVLLLVAALLVGAWCGLVSVGRLQRELPARPEQPSRRAVRPTAETAVGAMGVIALVLGEAWLEGSGRWPLVLAPVAGPLCLLLLVPTAATDWLVRGLPPEIAVVDVRRVALTGRPPRVDSLVEGLAEAYRVAGPRTGGVQRADADGQAEDVPGENAPQWSLGIAR